MRPANTLLGSAKMLNVRHYFYHDIFLNYESLYISANTLLCYCFFCFLGSDHLLHLFSGAGSLPHPDASIVYVSHSLFFLGLIALLVFDEPKFGYIGPYYLSLNFYFIIDMICY